MRFCGRGMILIDVAVAGLALTLWPRRRRLPGRA